MNGYEEATKLFQQWDEDDPKWKGISLKLKLCKRLIILVTITAAGSMIMILTGVCRLPTARQEDNNDNDDNNDNKDTDTDWSC